MKYAIEYNGKPALFSGKSIQEFHAYDIPLIIPSGETIMLCGWCDKNHHLTKRLKELGYETSHGICEQCSEKEFGYKPNNDNL